MTHLARPRIAGPAHPGALTQPRDPNDDARASLPGRHALNPTPASRSCSRSVRHGERFLIESSGSLGPGATEPLLRSRPIPLPTGLRKGAGAGAGAQLVHSCPVTEPWICQLVPGSDAPKVKKRALNRLSTTSPQSGSASRGFRPASVHAVPDASSRSRKNVGGGGPRMVQKLSRTASARTEVRYRCVPGGHLDGLTSFRDRPMLSGLVV